MNQLITSRSNNQCAIGRSLPISCLLVSLALFATDRHTRAEPYLAVQQGLKCLVCHTSPSGGGKRTAFGNAFTRSRLAQRKIGKSPWTGEIFKYLAVGGNLRGGFSKDIVPGQPSRSKSEFEEFLAYFEVRLIPQYVTFYLDKRLRPDRPVEREKYLRLSTKNGRFYLKAGNMFLPYGLRLQDDSAFIRQVSGINFNTPDRGWEGGVEHGNWSTQLAVTRGTAGGPEVDSGKQFSLRTSYVTPRWRLGGSFNFNNAKIGDRQMQNVFAGWVTGRVTWLAEVDYIIDEGSATGRRKFWTSLVEANVDVTKGHNLKLTFEFFDPDIDVSEDQRSRLSAIWEYFPLQFLQLRAGYRTNDGIPQNPAQNREQLFFELHVPF